MNLIDLFKDQIGGVLADKASSFLGEDKSKTSNALSAIIPSLLGGLVSKGSTNAGASGIMDMITKGGFNGDMLGNVAGLFSGKDSTNNLVSSGGNILSSLLGDKVGGIVNAISSFSGLGSGSSSSLLKMAAPLLMSVLGKQVMSKGLGVSGLMDLLSSQKSHVKSAMPAGLSGVSSLLGFADGIKDDVTTTVNRTRETVNTSAEAVRDTTVKAGKSGMGFLKWLLPLLALAAILFFVLRGCGGDVKNVGDAVKDAGNAVVDKTKDAGNAIADGAKDVVDAISKVTLPGGKEISFAANSFGDRVVKFLNGDKSDYSKAYTFDGLTFKTGSAELDAASEVQLNNLADILGAYPKFNVRIEGHTDNTGDAAVNKKLSSSRAKSVKAALVNKGVAATRIETKGYGQEKPVASNDTAEGRKQNRRVEMYFVK